jgi:hypothetical protein
MAFGWTREKKVILLKPLESSIPLALGDAETMKIGDTNP